MIIGFYVLSGNILTLDQDISSALNFGKAGVRVRRRTFLAEPLRLSYVKNLLRSVITRIRIILRDLRTRHTSEFSGCLHTTRAKSYARPNRRYQEQPCARSVAGDTASTQITP